MNSETFNHDSLTSTGNQPLTNENLLEPGTFLKDRYIVGHSDIISRSTVKSDNKRPGLPFVIGIVTA